MDLIAPTKPKGFRKMSIVFGNGKNTNARNSRDIYEYLGVKTRFNDWIKRTINKFGFVENEDFTVLKSEYGNDGKFIGHDYIVSEDMAKELCMISDTERGKDTRKYFVYMEKFARYLIEKKMQDCFITVEKKETKLLGQLEKAQDEIEKIKETIYAKPRPGDFQTIHRTMNDYSIRETPHNLNMLLVKKGVLSNKPHIISNFVPNKESNFAIKQGKTTLVYTPAVLEIVDSMGIERGLGDEDINQRLF